MNNLFIKTLLKMAVIGTALTACTFLYSFVESRPPKIIAFFIVTLIFSFGAGIVILLFARLSKVSRQSYVGDPFKLILTLVFIIGASKILGAYQAEREVFDTESIISDAEIEAVSPMHLYDNVDRGVSFSYPSNWSPKTPQKSSTLALLYEMSGSQATCNLSVIPQDQDRIEKYSQEYFAKTLSKMNESVDHVATELRTLNNKKVSWTTCDLLIQTETGELPAQFIAVTALHNGQRFMMILNIPKESRSLLDEDITTITNSLEFR